MSVSISIFKIPSIYMVIERYLEWRDFIHLTCTCKELYLEWVSSDQKRWKDLRLPRFIGDHVLRLFVPARLNILVSIRRRALDAIITGDAHWFPCMGGCGVSCSVRDLVSKELPYAVCLECAGNCESQGTCIIERHFEKHGLTDDGILYAKKYARKCMGKEKWKRLKPIFYNYWTRFYVKYLENQSGWLITVFKREDIEEKVIGLLRKTRI